MIIFFSRPMPDRRAAIASRTVVTRWAELEDEAKERQRALLGELEGGAGGGAQGSGGNSGSPGESVARDGDSHAAEVEYGGQRWTQRDERKRESPERCACRFDFFFPREIWWAKAKEGP